MSIDNFETNVDMKVIQMSITRMSQRKKNSKLDTQ